MIHTVYANGRGGKHRDSADARHWRALSAEIARNLRTARPRMLATFVVMHAELETESVTRELNRKARREATRTLYPNA